MRITYTLHIDADLEESGDYYGSKSTLDWFVEHANQDTRSLRVFVAHGATEPVEVRAKIGITKITMKDL